MTKVCKCLQFTALFIGIWHREMQIFLTFNCVREWQSCFECRMHQCSGSGNLKVAPRGQSIGCVNTRQSASCTSRLSNKNKSYFQAVACLPETLFNQAVPPASPLFTPWNQRQPRVTTGMFRGNVFHIANVNTWRTNIISPLLFSSFFSNSPRSRRHRWKAPWQQNLKKNNLTRGHLLPFLPPIPSFPSGFHLCLLNLKLSRSSRLNSSHAEVSELSCAERHLVSGFAG